MDKVLRAGIDVGSTTVKVVALDADDNVVYKDYQRHLSNVVSVSEKMLGDLCAAFPENTLQLAFTGSAGIDLSRCLERPFVQEVIACTKAVRRLLPKTDVVIELGGEDAKVTYLRGSVEQRMNGVCAGGTGAFIDQMACLLSTDAPGLNELASRSSNTYPIASRCGVFAKTDIQALMNDGASKEDIAASVLQAVVNQTISSLAHGRAIEGTVAFLGGPLHFLDELRRHFIDTLHLTEEQALCPDLAQYYVAIGAAMASSGEAVLGQELLMRLPQLYTLTGVSGESRRLEPLFANSAELEQFRKRHSQACVPKQALETYRGSAYLGIDAGSTTTKLALISADKKLLYSYYGSNQGQPLSTAVQALRQLYEVLPAGVTIAASAVTGYGEQLLKAALQVDFGEVETVAHLKAASFFQPQVTFVLDIGGQDMKSFVVRDGAINSIMLNEACSSGCGSFIETFARSLKLEVSEFAQVALLASRPVDLGTRCTVFMNSKVKQAQREGASVGDISAGLAVSVIKNALFKVIRLKNAEDLGEHVVVQGGTFYNEAVLRAIEKLLGYEVVRPDIAGIMGAYGAALVAQERAGEEVSSGCHRAEAGQVEASGRRSTLIGASELREFVAETESRRCGQCGNNCLLTVQQFPNGGKYITGNRCERGAGVQKTGNAVPNIYDFKYKRLFQYKPWSSSEAKRGVIGIPRALNIYEDYPFWFTFFHELGYRVVLSGRSSARLFALGMDSIASETVCYPAQLVHGHIADLIKRGVKRIFYPCLPFSRVDAESCEAKFNCPVVTSYPETIAANMTSLQSEGVEFLYPFVSLQKKERLAKRLQDVLAKDNIAKGEMKVALDKAYAELERYRSEVRQKGEEILEQLRRERRPGVVLLGRPYHIDPEVNHGLPELIQSYGLAVLSEDAVAHLADSPQLRFIDQWELHSRLYRAANFVGQSRDVQIEAVQLNSFGCGLDAITLEQVQEILAKYYRLHTVIKLDAINNLGAARIRLRSLLAALHERWQRPVPEPQADRPLPPVFTKGMNAYYTLLGPQMAPDHQYLIAAALQREGYNLVFPEIDRQNAVDNGLKFVHNDICYPAILVIGHFLQALKSGKFDTEKTGILYFQTAGGCRASNYTAFLRKALDENGFASVPVVSIFGRQSPGFSFTFSMLCGLARGLAYGDLLQKLSLRLRPYEAIRGQVRKLYDEWHERCRLDLLKGNRRSFVANIRQMVADFEALPIKEDVVKPRVGIVGEILVKYLPAANNNLVELLEREGAEAVVPSYLSFLLYCAYDWIAQRDLLAGSMLAKAGARLFIKGVESYLGVVNKVLSQSRRFSTWHPIDDLAAAAKKFVSVGNMTGEGWLMCGEIVSMLKEGINNIVLVQPFGCLPNHVVAKGIMKRLRQEYPQANLVAIDYDSALSEVNQLNRIKLMLSVGTDALGLGNG